MTKEQIKEFTLRTSQSNHSGLMLVLLDMEVVYMEDALNEYASGDIPEYLNSVEKAKKTLNEFIDCFNPGDLLGRRVIQILRYIYKQLVASGVKREPQDIDRCIGMLDTLKPAIEKLHDIDDEGPVMQNTHKVYAGMTYGKGTLNESVDSADYARRGYTV